MTDYGVTPTGFVKKDQATILDEIETAWLAGISPALNLEAAGFLGEIAGTLADREASLWDLGQALYDAFDPDQATDFSQDALCTLTGTHRKPATNSKVTCTMTLAAGKTIPAGSACYVLGNPAARFELVADVTSVGAGDYPGTFLATVTGPIVANAGTLTVIATPVDGWIAVTNTLDAVVGSTVEASTALRIRREAELTITGSTTPDAIRADLLDPNNPALVGGAVRSVFVFENDSDVTDGNGLPPRSIEVLIDDGLAPSLTNDQIAQAIWGARGAGVVTYGTTAGNAIDALGNVRVVRFSRPAARPVYLTIDLTPGTGFGGDVAVKNAVVAYGGTLADGGSVYLSAFYASIFGVGGVTKIVDIKAGFAPAPAGTADLAIGTRERAVFDTSRVVVNHV